MSKTNIGYGGYKQSEFPFNEYQKWFTETLVCSLCVYRRRFVLTGI